MKNRDNYEVIFGNQPIIPILKMKTVIGTITPEVAQQILETRNKTNRNISSLFVNKLANDIINGTFLLTHQGIAFDEEGDLLDGQHRLAACVKANMSIQVLVTSGIKRTHNLDGIKLNTFEIIDSGKARTVAQMLTIGGVKNSSSVAAAAKVLALMCLKSRENIGITSAQVHKILHITNDTIHKCSSIAKSGSILKAPSWIVGPLCLYHLSYPEKAEDFLWQFVNLSAPAGVGSPTRTLGQYYSCHKTAGGGSQQIAWIKYTNHAIHSFHTNKKINKVFSSDISTDWLLRLNPEITYKIASTITL